MSAIDLDYLQHLADNPDNRNHAPKAFIDAMELKQSPAEYIRSAWRLFIDTGVLPNKDQIRDHLRKRKAGKLKEDTTEDLPVGCANSHFLDSGAFTLWTIAAKWHEEKPGSDRWGYYETEEFWDYIDSYALFIKKWAAGIDHYANVDVIPQPDLTWRNQQYLEKKHGLRPVPVVHYKTDLKWLKHYIDNGYDFIGLGGLVGSTSQDACRAWIDDCFEMVCDQSSRLPRVKLHGFGVTTYSLLTQYPWYSVDSTSWTKSGAFGTILVPHKRNGQWVFDIEPYQIKVSIDSPDRKKSGAHVLTLTSGEKAIIQDWLDFIGIPLGKMDAAGEVLEYGVVTRHTERRQANLHFFELMRNSIPKYPWPFRSKRRKSLGIF